MADKSEKSPAKKVTKPSLKTLIGEIKGELSGDLGWIPAETPIIYGRDTEEQDNSLFADHRAFNEANADMAAEMAENGVRDPAKVVLAKADGKYRLLLVDGRQRTINLRAANAIRAEKGLEPLRLPIKVVTLDGTAILSESVILNEHRVQDNPISRAEKAKAMMDKGMELKAVARSFMVKPSTIKKQWLPVLEMHPVIVEAVKSGQFALNAAIELVSLTPEQQEETFNKLKEEGKLNMAAAEGARRAIRGGGAEESEGEEGSSKKPYVPFSKKWMAAFVEWSDEAGKAGNTPTYQSFHALGYDKDGNLLPTHRVLREMFQHLLGKKVTPGIPGWKAAIKRMETPVEEEAPAEEPAAEEKKPAPKKSAAKKG